MPFKVRELELIGVPCDFGAGRRGVDMGPSAMRYAGLAAGLAVDFPPRPLPRPPFDWDFDGSFSCASAWPQTMRQVADRADMNRRVRFSMGITIPHCDTRGAERPQRDNPGRECQNALSLFYLYLEYPHAPQPFLRPQRPRAQIRP